MTDLALVTGSSSGIGLELARLHAARGGDLVLVARRRDRLEQLQQELQTAFGVNVGVINRDLSVSGAAEALYEELASDGTEIDYLINNAGFGGYGLFHERDWARDRAMIELNVMALTALTRLALPGMVQRRRGRVLNVASVAGFVPGPFQAVYFATKAYVVSFSQALASELDGTGVTVTALCPGATETEFAKAGDLEGAQAFRNAASARSVASYGYEAMLRGRTVAIPGLRNRALLQVTRALPLWAITRISRSLIEKR